MLGNDYSCIMSSCLTAYSVSIMARSGMEASLVLVHKFALLPRSAIPIFFKNVLFGSTLRPFYHPLPKHSHHLYPCPENGRHLVKTQTLVTRLPSPVTSPGSMSSPSPRHDRISRELCSVLFFPKPLIPVSSREAQIEAQSTKHLTSTLQNSPGHENQR